MKHRLTALLGLAIAIVASSGAIAQDKSGSAGNSEDRPFIEELIRIPRAGTPAGLVTRICRPRKATPAPLVVINHGRPAGATGAEAREKRAKMKPSPCGLVSEVFRSRGYVVAFPLRRGYGETGGSDREQYGACDNADFYTPSVAAADDVEAVVRHMKTLPYVAKDGAIVIGQSAGGMATIALAARRLDGIAAFINFAGGRGGRRKNQPNNNCSPGAVVSAVERFGSKVRGPMLWVYTENDTFFGPAMARQMHAAFRKAGGTAELVMLPPFRTASTNDGHALFFASGGQKVWEPIVFRWLESVKAKMKVN